jgi:methylmalonyl-CoA mutase N-terminal domain/subunit
VVGINAGLNDGDLGSDEVQPFELPPGALDAQRARIGAVRARRSEPAVTAALEELAAACAEPGVNVMPAVIGAVAADATLGEIGAVLRDTLGRWHFPLW